MCAKPGPPKLLLYKKEHVPISVSVGDTLHPLPTHICDRDPDLLITKFVQELKRRAKNIQERVSVEVLPEDMDAICKKTRERMNEWCYQVPFLGFNCGNYDLHFIQRFFVKQLADAMVNVVKKHNKIMFLWSFLFLFSYEWFDTVAKLNCLEQPAYELVYSSSSSKKKTNDT